MLKLLRRLICNDEFYIASTKIYRHKVFVLKTIKIEFLQCSKCGKKRIKIIKDISGLNYDGFKYEINIFRNWKIPKEIIDNYNYERIIFYKNPR